MALQQTLALSRARRVAGMGLAEIGCRTRQASAKWIDRLQHRVGEPSDVLRRQAPAIANPDAALQALRDDLPRRFFAGVSPEVIATIRDQFPEARRELLSQAERLLGGHFDLLGYHHLSFGHPIDWHLDPVNRRRAPRVHWSAIDPLDSEIVGDSKVVWELSRHQWTMQLAQAYALTGDERYAAAAIAAMNDWIDANPVGIGINWSSSLEVALRLMAWTWTLALLRQSAALTGGTLIRVLSSIHAHATHVEKYLSRYFSPNTHLTGEALGLFYAGVAFPEFRDAERWRATGATTLIEQADQQVSVDGIYFEQSTCYQRYTCDIYLHFLQLAGRHHIDVPARTREHLQRMVDVLVTLRGPDGMVPAIGDADGGQLMPLVIRERGDCRGIFAAAAALFGRRDFAHAAGGAAPEVGWLLGAEGADAFARAATGQPATEPSRIFVAGGYAVMRTGSGRDACQMIVDVGPLGSFGHGHADLLSVQCSVFGHACLVDAGTYAYTAEPEWRSYFRGTAAHNTVRIDGTDQAEPAGPFGWHERPRTTVRAWQSTSELDLVDAEHTAFVAQGIPVVHRRRVVFAKPHYWVVVDDLLGDGSHSAEWSFQFAPVPVSLTSGGDAARADLPGGEALWVVPLSTTAIRASVHTGEVAPIRGWVSPDYGRRVPAPMLVFAAQGPLPMRQLTVLVPQRRQSTSPPSVDPILDGSRRLVGVRVTLARLTVHFDPHVVIARD
jgi:hypothetical protein